MTDLVFRERAVYLPATETLVVADLHVGRGESAGVEFPLGERADLQDRLAALVSEFSPDEAVFAGDVFHDFGGPSLRAEECFRALVDDCRQAGVRPVVLVGNHDTTLDRVWDGSLRREYRAGDVLVCHGDEAPEGSAPLVVAGHDHPAIVIEGQKRPCHLYGEGVYRGGDVLVLPAFSRVVRGAAVNGMTAADFQSPLVTDADAFRPVVYDGDSGETLRFPPLGEFRRML